MKFTKITLIVVSILALGVFLIINQMTPEPGTTFGNGNPALLVASILFPSFIIMVILWVRIFRKLLISTTIYIISICSLLTHLTVALLYRQKELNEYREVIKNALLNRDGVADVEYVYAITSGLSFHINNQNFNINTYFMFVTFSILVAIVYILSDNLGKEKRK